MSFHELVIQSQLQPPRPRKNLLRRPRLEARLSSIFDYPLTVIQAGTGYGKSTALGTLVSKGRQVFWYTITESDRDPLLFLIHLFSAFGDLGSTALQFLEANDGLVAPAVLTPLLNALSAISNSELVLILDDFHLVSNVEEIIALVKKLVDFCPAPLHIVLSVRQMPDFIDINRWRVKGILSIISSNELAFTVDEIETLFREQYGYPLSGEQALALAQETEGWAMALQMVWQGLQSGIMPDIDTALQKLPFTLDRLFDYLAPEVLARQPAYQQNFLVTTSVLREMDGPSCDALLDTHDGASNLRHLYDIGLFVDLVGEGTYRYQRLFHDFLLKQVGTDPQKKIDLHQRAARYFEFVGQPENTLFHLLEAQDYFPAANLLEKIGTGLLTAGRLDSLNYWLNHLPAKYRSGRPSIEMLYGDVCRLRADFEAALSHYENAIQLYKEVTDPLGQSRALRGQAQLFLDTVRPLQAAALLADAVDLLDPSAYPQESADLLQQLAENKLNFGFPDKARELHQDSLRLRTGPGSTDIYLDARILLRTGQLSEARQILESYMLDEPIPGQLRQQHFHREKQLLLSLIAAMQGDQRGAEQYARQGVAIGKKMQSEYVEAVAFMRLGHALQLDCFSPWSASQRNAAIDCYKDVIEKVAPFKVPRVSLEPLWGLCRAYGYGGNVEAAEVNARRAIDISRTAGDEWIGHLVRVCMGAVLAMDGRHAASSHWLKEAAEGLDRVRDKFGWCTAQLWLALNAWWQGEEETALRHLSALLPVVSENSYEFLLTKRTHLGLKDDQSAIPLLLEAYRQNIEREFILRLLSQAGKRGLEYHPGYTLWVRTLGPFEVWRGDKLINQHEWQREKARQLFQLFITNRNQWLQREQIVDLLWPDLSTESAASNFKVALNTLNRAIEPGRPHNTPSYFIIRRGSAYGINPQAHIVTDGEVFINLSSCDEQEKMQSALLLYQDDYLPESCYCDWASIERNNYRQKYMDLVSRLAYQYINSQQWEDALSLCTSALRRDKYWEPAYTLMMRAYAAQGNLAQVQAVYQRCETILRNELDVEPSQDTQRLFKLITKGY